MRVELVTAKSCGCPGLKWIEVTPPNCGAGERTQRATSAAAAGKNAAGHVGGGGAPGTKGGAWLAPAARLLGRQWRPELAPPLALGRLPQLARGVALDAQLLVLASLLVRCHLGCTMSGEQEHRGLGCQARGRAAAGRRQQRRRSFQQQNSLQCSLARWIAAQAKPGPLTSTVPSTARPTSSSEDVSYYFF